MKNTTITTFRSALLVAALAFAPLAASLHAQTAQRVEVDVPFAFQDGAKTMPAGVYTLTQASGHILTIQGKTVGAAAMARMEDAGPIAPSKGKVVFHHYGSQYFLSEVWRTDESNHSVCARTSAEMKAKRATQIAATKTAPSTVELALLSPPR